MPAELVFITGGTGFIGGHVIKEILEADYRARLSVRRESSVQELKDLFPQHVEQLDFVVIRDITKSDSFYSALHGVRYILHIASPIPGTSSDFKRDHAEAAVKGTISILEAAGKALSVKRVVVESSANAFMPLDWMSQKLSEVTPGTTRNIKINVDSMVPSVDPMSMYHASKVSAQQACLDWAEAHVSLHFDIVTMHPALAIGNNLLGAPALSGSSNGVLWNTLFIEQVSFLILGVDVRNVALAHLRVLEAELPSGVNEFLLGSPDWSWDLVVESIKTKYPGFGLRLKGPFPDSIKPQSKKAEKLLEIRWTNVKDSISALIDQQVNLGQVRV